MAVARNIIETLRPRQWVKSFFVLAPALFTLKLLNPTAWLSLSAGFFGFSLAASGLYTLNDIFDRREDHLHPVKQFRPIAAGRISLSIASIISALCIASGVLMIAFFSLEAALIVSLYVVLMITYTVVLRRINILDVIVIAIGFVLRVKVGAELISEPMSHWLLLCTFAIALFLAMIKRRQELIVVENISAPQSRYALTNYPPVSVIDGWINILAGMTIICYALYTVDPETVAKYSTDSLIYTLPLVVYGIFRYQKLAISGRAGEDPAWLVLKDTGLKIVVILWSLMAGIIVYLGNQ